MKLDTKSIDYLEYESEIIKDGIAYSKDFDGKQEYIFEKYIRPNLPMIAYLKAQSRTDRQVALTLGISPALFSKIKGKYELLRDACTWGKEVVGDKLELRGFQLAMSGEKNYKYWETITSKLNPKYSKDQADRLSNLDFNKLEININDMSIKDTKLKEEYDDPYKDRLNSLRNTEEKDKEK